MLIPKDPNSVTAYPTHYTKEGDLEYCQCDSGCEDSAFFLLGPYVRQRWKLMDTDIKMDTGCGDWESFVLYIQLCILSQLLSHPNTLMRYVNTIKVQYL